MLSCACLPWVCKPCTSVAPAPIVVLPIPLNLVFLMACSSWDLAVPHLPALSGAGCVCVSPRDLIKQAVSHVSPRLCPCPGWQGGPASHRDRLAHPRDPCEPGAPRAAAPQLPPHLSFPEVGQISSREAISFIFQKLPRL